MCAAEAIGEMRLGVVAPGGGILVEGGGRGEVGDRGGAFEVFEGRRAFIIASIGQRVGICLRSAGIRLCGGAAWSGVAGGKGGAHHPGLSGGWWGCDGDAGVLRFHYGSTLVEGMTGVGPWGICEKLIAAGRFGGSC